MTPRAPGAEVGGSGGDQGAGLRVGGLVTLGDAAANVPPRALAVGTDARALRSAREPMMLAQLADTLADNPPALAHRTLQRSGVPMLQFSTPRLLARLLPVRYTLHVNGHSSKEAQ